MNTCKRYGTFVIIAIFIVILFGTALTVNLVRFESSADKESGLLCSEQICIDKHISFQEPAAFPLSENGYEQSREFNGFRQFSPLYNFKAYYLFRILFYTNLSSNKLDNLIVYYCENIAQKKLEGYYIYSLRKLLI